jgi:hypothetical protein
MRDMDLAGLSPSGLARGFARPGGKAARGWFPSFSAKVITNKLLVTCLSNTLDLPFI